MIDLDERLNSASQAIRAQVSKVPMRPPNAVSRRHRRGRALLAVLGLGVGLTALTAAGTLLTGDRDVAAGPTTEPAYTYTLDLPGWTLVGVWESPDDSGTSHTLFDRLEGDIPRRIMFESGSAAQDRVATLQSLEVEPTATITLDGEEAVFYDTSRLYEAEEQAGLMAFSTLAATWTTPEGQPFVFLFEGIGVDEVTALLVERLMPMSRDDWHSMTAGYEPPVTTTIVNK